MEISVDVNRVIAMLLVHDLGEIDAGDKFVFAQDGWEDRKVAELRAVERIYDIAPLKVADLLITLYGKSSMGAELRKPVSQKPSTDACRSC